MKTPLISNFACIELQEQAGHVMHGDQGWVVPLAETGGAIVDPARPATGGRPVLCLIPARGATLRRLSLPAAARENPARLLALQIEAQFPLPPGELAWGFAALPSGPETGALREFLVVALRKSLLDEHAARLTRILPNAGATAVFSLAALARRGAAPRAGGAFGILEVGEQRSELITFDDRGPVSLRVILWGGAQAEDTDALARLLDLPAGAKLYLSASDPAVQSSLLSIAARLSAPGGTVCEVLGTGGAGKTAATRGAQRLAEQGDGILSLRPDVETAAPSVPARNWRWAMAAAGLLLLSFALRYAEPMLFRSGVSKRLAEVTRYRGSLPEIERELNFLEYIRSNQPPCLDTLAVIAQATSPGLKLDSLSVARRGDVSFRGMAPNPQAPGQMRAKLIESGFFSKVTVEEQTPAPQGQNVTFRISAMLRPEEERKPLPPEKPLTNQPAAFPGASPGPRFPGGPPMMGRMLQRP